MGLRSKTAKTKRGSTRRARTSKGRTKTAKALAPKTKKAVEAIVAKAISRKSETKIVSSYPSDSTPNVYTQVDSVISGAGQWGSALPLLTQGNTDFQRDGNTISPRQLKVLLDVRLTGESSGTSSMYPKDITCVVYYGYCKKYRNWNDVNTNSAALCTDLLRLGGLNGSGAETQAFGGIQSDSHLLINTDVWSLKKITFRLAKGAGYVNGSPTPPYNTTGGLCLAKNNHAVLLDFGSMLPETLKYDENTDQLPTNFAPVYTMGYYYNDRTDPDIGAANGIVEYKANRILTFKDM